MAIDVGTATGYLDLDISGFIRGLQSANTEAAKQSQTLESTLGSGLQTIGGKLEGAGKALTVGVTTPVIAMGTAAVKTSATFEAGMSQIQATMGITKDSMSTLDGQSVNTMDALSNLAQEMGASTKFSATEAADAINILAMAGYDTEKIYGSLPNILNLAAAGGLGIADAADIATGVMAGFNLKAEDSSMVADKIATMASSAKGSVGEFGQAMATAAGQASVTGQSFDDTAVALEILGNHNLSAAEGGNALNRILKNLYQPTEQAAAAMEELGVSAYDADGKARALPDVLQDFQDKLGGLTDEEYNNIMGQIFDSATMKSVPFLINDCTAAWDTQDDTVTSLIEGIRGAEDAYGGIGAASGQAQAQMDNLEGQITLLKSALEGVAIQIGNILMPYIKSFVERIQNLVDWFANLDEGTQQTIVKMALLAAAVGPVLIGIGKLVSGVGGAIRGFNEIKGAFTAIKTGFSLLSSSAAGAGASIGAIAGPVLAVVAAIAVLVAAFKHLWDTNEEFRNKITGIWDGIKAKFEEFTSGIVERLNALGFDFENITEVIGAIWNGFCELLAPWFEAAFSQIANIFSTVCDIITGILDVFIGLFTGNWDQMWQGVKEIFGAVWDFIKNTFEIALNGIKGLADVVLGWFGTSWEEVWTNVSNFFKNIWEGIKTFFQNAVTTIQNVATTVFTAVSSFFTTIWNGIKTVFTTVVTAISTFLTNTWNMVYNTIMSVFQAVSQFITTIWNTIKQTITSIVTTIWNTIATIWNNILLTITEIVLGISNIISNIFNAIKEFLKGNTEQAKEHIRQAWQTAYNLVTAIINNMKNTISTVFNAIKSIIQTIMQAVQTILTTIWNAINTVVTNVVNAIKNTISSVFTAIKSTIQTIMEAIQTTLTNVWNAIKTTVTNVVEAVKTTVSNAFTNMKSSVTNTINSLKSSIENVFNGIKTAMSNAIETAKSNVINAMTNAKNGMVNAFNGIGDTFRNIGKNVIQGLINGIGDMVGKLYDSIKEALSGLVDKAKDALGIESPSKVFAKQIGRWIPPGIAKGFDDAMPDAISDMEDSLNDGIDNMDVDNINVVADLQASFSAVVGWFESMEQRLANAVQGMRDELVALVQAGQMVVGADGSLSYVGYGGFRNSALSVSSSTGNSNGQTRSGGDTFIFNSPKAIDEIEAARQMEKTKRDMAEGF